ncbi:uncharacterized, partial [Tachysurus ichikawai]
RMIDATEPACPVHSTSLRSAIEISQTVHIDFVKDN